MRYFHKLKNKFHMPTINTDKLNTLISDEVRCISLSGSPFHMPFLWHLSVASTARLTGWWAGRSHPFCYNLLLRPA